jgi:aspartyl/glutamyl-tRNA(Asn/Gln) amidotransferase C subunit
MKNFSLWYNARYKNISISMSNNKITEEIVEKIGKLARVDMSKDQVSRITDSFGPIMEMIEQINSVELGDDVQRNFRLKNVMREDIIREDTSENRDAILEEFPKTQKDYLQTKKILG